MLKPNGEFVCTEDEKAEVSQMLDIHEEIQRRVDYLGDTPETKQIAYDSLMKTGLGDLYRQSRDCVLSFPGYAEDDLPVVEVPEFGTVAMITLVVGVSTIVVFSRNKINY